MPRRMCAARGLDPLTTNLVVADASRTEKTHLPGGVALAEGPGDPGAGTAVRGGAEGEGGQRRPAAGRHPQRRRPAEEGKYCLSDPSYDADALAKDPALEIAYLVAPPRMAYYETVSRQVYGVYLRYIAPEDIVVYSIDEVFIDATPYLDLLQDDRPRAGQDHDPGGAVHHRHHRHRRHRHQPLPGQAGHGHHRQARRPRPGRDADRGTG